MEVTKTSILTGIEHTMDIDITPQQLEMIEMRRELGIPIQKIVPHLSADLREFLINGISPEEWSEQFGPDEYENERYVDEHER